MRPHLKCLRQQVAVFKKHVSFCLMSREPEAMFLLLAILPKSRGKLKKGKRKGKSLKGGKPANLGTPHILPKPHTSRSESRPPMSKKRPTEVGATRGGPHHAPRLRPDQCMLCRQVGHRLSQQKKSDRILTGQTGIWYLCSGLCSVRCPMIWCNCRRNRTRSRRE